MTEGLSSSGYCFILRHQGSTLLIYYCQKSLAGMPSYLPFPEAWGGGGEGKRDCGRLNRGKRARKDKATDRSRVRLANENYTAVQKKELKEHKLMLIGSIDKQGLLDLWCFLKVNSILII